MISKKIILGAIGGMIVLATANSYAAPLQFSNDGVAAREASEGPRGGDNERPGDRQRRGGRISVDADSTIIAKETGSQGRGRGKDGVERPGYSTNLIIIAREASEGPRGGDNERPGDRQRRGGRNA